jgi:hypothetical protein
MTVRGKAMRKGVNTMMDLSSVLDATLTFAGVFAVLWMGISTLSSESTTAFVTPGSREEVATEEYAPVWRKAA